MAPVAREAAMRPAQRFARRPKIRVVGRVGPDARHARLARPFGRQPVSTRPGPWRFVSHRDPTRAFPGAAA